MYSGCCATGRPRVPPENGGQTLRMTAPEDQSNATTTRNDATSGTNRDSIAADPTHNRLLQLHADGNPGGYRLVDTRLLR